jgi:hypothetical protein
VESYREELKGVEMQLEVTAQTAYSVHEPELLTYKKTGVQLS